MQSRVLDKVPRFGWTRKTLMDDVALGDGGGVSPVTTPAVRRPPGMFQVAVQLRIPPPGSTGVGQIGAVLEGSNTGDVSNDLEWFPIASLNLGNTFISPFPGPDRRLLGSTQPVGGGVSLNYGGGSGNVNLGRFAFLRVRTEIKLGTIDVLAFPTTAPGATITISGVTLTPAGGPRTPGLNDYDNTLGSFALIAADINAAINDASNDFGSTAGVFSDVAGSVVTVQIFTDLNSGFTMTSGLPSELSVGPNFDDMFVKITGTQGDGESFLKPLNVVSESGEPNEQTSDFIERPAGTRYLTSTAKLVAAVFDPPGATGYTVRLEGAVDLESALAGVFANMSTQVLDDVSPGTGSPPIGRTKFFSPTGGLVIDMGPFNYFRYSVEPQGLLPPGDVSSYTILCSSAFDDNDWIDGEQGLTELSSSLQSQFIQVKWGEPEPQSGTTVQITGQFVDMNGVPLRNQNLRRAFLIASASFEGKSALFHPTATLNSADVRGGTGNQTKMVVGTSSGAFTVVVDSNGVPTTVYLSAENYVDDPPNGTLFPYTLMGSEIVSIVVT